MTEQRTQSTFARVESRHGANGQGRRDHVAALFMEFVREEDGRRKTGRFVGPVTLVTLVEVRSPRRTARRRDVDDPASRRPLRR